MTRNEKSKIIGVRFHSREIQKLEKERLTKEKKRKREVSMSEHIREEVL